jgi:adenylate cyclase class 2
MKASTREIEIKLRFDSADAARSALHRLGAGETIPRHFEDNQLFDRANDALKPAGKALRVRRAAGRAWLTFKAPVGGEFRHKVVDEHETEVADPDALTRVLAGLGFARAWRYQKHRTVFAFQGVTLFLDETPLGCFVELEGEAEAIDRVAASLGFAPESYVRESYRALHERRAREAGRPAGDLIVEEAGDARR